MGFVKFVGGLSLAGLLAGCSASAAVGPLTGQQKIESLLAAGYEVKAGEYGQGLIDVFLQKGASLYFCEGSDETKRIRSCIPVRS